MSWDSYVDSVVGDCSIVTKATIIGLNGSVWTPQGGQSKNLLDISTSEASDIAKVMNHKNEQCKATFATSGITVGGTRYMFLRDVDGDGRIMLGKKSGVGQLILESTCQAIVIAFIPEANCHSAGVANGLVDKICKYLEGSGY